MRCRTVVRVLRRSLVRIVHLVLVLALSLTLLPGQIPSVQAAVLLPGFQESIVFSGLVEPTTVRFSSDGRVFVAEKSGVIKVFDGLSDPTPTVFANLHTNVYNFWDRGLLGLALDPNFPASPYVYVMYTHDAAIGGTAPRWGIGTPSDPCPTPPGATSSGCVVSSRVSRLQAAGNVMTGAEKVLVEDWCQQFPSHSAGSLVFGADGALYVSGGEGAAFHFLDYGQTGIPLNPCGDPPGGVGGILLPPTAEGGALRSQDLRTPGDPVTLDGTIIRIDPASGAALADNPLASHPDANARRIVAHGLRNPFRITARPGTNEIWVGDPGSDFWEEINRIVAPTAKVENFGWPCFEGPARQPGYDALNLNICESLYAAGPGAVTQPYFAYRPTTTIAPNDTCQTGSSTPAGVAFYSGGSYPAEYNGALFFADYARKCIWAMLKGPDNLPNPGAIRTLMTDAANPVDLQTGPGGDLYYVDFNGGTVRRIQFFGANQPPTAVATANPVSGPAPLTVAFDGTGSSDPEDGKAISYAWDLDGDGQFDDATVAKPTYTYTQNGAYTARLRVTDSAGAAGTAEVQISVGNTPPKATIVAPAVGTTWKVGDTIAFSGSATDSEDGTLGGAALTWSVILHHCPSTCHTHPLQTLAGTAIGSFTAPDHSYPSHLEIKLTATDSGGLTDTKSVQLDPETLTLTFQSVPPGLQLTAGGAARPAPFTDTVIAGSTNSISAPSPQTLDDSSYSFASWSDGGAQTHNVVANTAATYTAEFTAASPTPAPEGTVRVNSGGPAYTDGGGQAWTADAFFSGGFTAGFSTPIAGTTDDPLYQTQRYGNFSYNLSLPNGSYEVSLKFAESFWGSPGQRVFNVSIEDEPVLTDFDILRQTAPNTALDKTFVASVSDRTLSVTFSSVTDFAVVSAIQVRPLDREVRVNSGGSAMTDVGGWFWAADTGFTGGSTATFSAPIERTVHDSLYQSQRYGDFSYELAVPNGDYAVTLKFVESFWSNRGQRVFHVDLQGRRVLANFDLLGEAPRNNAIDVTFPASVTDGTLSITFTSVVDFAVVSAVEARPAKVAKRVNSGGASMTDASGHLWSADTGFTGGLTAGFSAPIGRTVNDSLYQTQRYGNFGYSFDVPNGDYTVTMKFAESYWTAIGQRVFNVDIQGRRVLTNFDILREAAPNEAVDLTFTATVTNGTVTIGFNSVTDFAVISAIAVVPL